MKRLTSLLSILAFTLAFSGSAFAQTDITASAQIVNSISVDNTTQDLNFGQLQGNFGSNVVVDPLNGNQNTGQGTVQAGSATISASPNVDFQVTVIAPTELSNTASGVTETIPFTAHFYGDQDNDLTTAGDNTGLNSDGSSNTVTTNGNTSGPNYYLHLGGELTPKGSGSYAGGTYEGTITVDVNYLQ